MTQQHRPDDPRPDRPSNTSHSARSNTTTTHSRRVTVYCVPEGGAHLLFGSVEELLADLAASGGPEGGLVRVERLVRTQPSTLGGTATLGVAVTARRANELSETLSAWVIVARVSLDPRGQALAPTQAQEAARQHHEAQRLISALVADAGYAPRSGVYLLRDGCYNFTATAEPLAALGQHTELNPKYPDAPMDVAIESDDRSEGGGSDA